MSKKVKPTVVAASDSEESSPLAELVSRKKPINGNATAPVKGKPAQKQAPPKADSDDETPAQPKKNVAKPPRKGSKASVDEEAPKRKASVDKPAKKPLKAKEPSSEEEEEVKPKKAQKAVVPPKKPAKESSSESEEPVKPVAKKAVVPPKKKADSDQSDDEIIAPPKKAVVQTKDKKQTKLKKKESSSEDEPEPPKKVVVQPKKVAKKQTSSEEQQQQPKPRKVSKEAVKVDQKKKALKKQSSEQESEQQKPVQKKPAKKVVPKKDTSSEQEQQQKPAPKRKPSADVKKPAKKQVSDDDEQQEKPAPKRKPSADVKKPAKKVEQQQKMEDENEENNEDDETGQFEVAVQGLSFNAFDSDIRELFNECGNILNVKLISRPDGKPKGFAFVKFSKKSSFNKALELNGADHMGRQIRVEQARGNGQKQQQRGGNTRGVVNQAPGSAVIETPTLFIGGLSFQSTNDSIKQFFSSIGQVQSARVVTDKETQKPRGFGYVEFYDVDTARKAYEQLNGAYLDGRQIRLDSAAPRDRPNNGGGFGNRQGGGGNFQRGNNNNRQGSAVELSQDDRFAKKGAIAGFAGKKIQL